MLQMYPHGVLEPGGMKNHVGDSDMHMEFVHGSSPARHKLCARVQWASKQHAAAALCSAHARVSSSAVGDQRELRRHSKLVHLWGSAGVSSWRAHGACRRPHTRAALQCHARRSPGRGLSQAAPTFTWSRAHLSSSSTLVCTRSSPRADATITASSCLHTSFRELSTSKA